MLMLVRVHLDIFMSKCSSSYVLILVPVHPPTWFILYRFVFYRFILVHPRGFRGAMWRVGDLGVKGAGMLGYMLGVGRGIRIINMFIIRIFSIVISISFCFFAWCVCVDCVRV
jgi:hypothetical protein